jgi:hypothetical protein
MNKIWGVVIFVLLAWGTKCGATDLNTEKMLRITTVDHAAVTQADIIKLYGTPTKQEETRKRVKWYYVQGNCTLEVDWRSDGTRLEKFVFTNEVLDKKECDLDLQKKLKAGDTDIAQALKLLGVPADMTLREETQIMHYSFQGSMARLFFRNNKLVDYALVESRN